jgi:hypothetical protein
VRSETVVGLAAVWQVGAAAFVPLNAFLGRSHHVITRNISFPSTQDGWLLMPFPTISTCSKYHYSVIE